jgi:hypothetical protein
MIYLEVLIVVECYFFAKNFCKKQFQKIITKKIASSVTDAELKKSISKIKFN